MRRGALDLIPWLSRVVLLVVVGIFVVLLVRSFVDKQVDASDVELSAYLYRIHYDRNIIAYEDSLTKRVYPGYIDTQKFRSVNLNKIFPMRTPDDTFSDIASKIVAIAPGCSIDKQFIMNNEITFNRYFELAKQGLRGPQSATILVERWPVTFVDGDTKCQGILEISVVRPNS